ncbi:hypothetical protein Tco_0953845 [Tanacetum coccineum]|uniref:Uncharacterized protein n=1 Tax=Tanacetum coccineum TaxID=301880 RepID=A0ABQ5E136_9ASTR
MWFVHPELPHVYSPLRSAMSRRLQAFTSFFLQIFSSAVEGTVIFNVVDGPDSGVVTGIVLTNNSSLKFVLAAQMVDTLRVIRDMRREMSDIQAELLALWRQQREL